MKIAAVIPAFNEYASVTAVVDQTLPYVEAVVVVDDGSGRPLRRVLPNDPRITVLRHRINLGKGAALKTGVEYVRRLGFDAVIFLDGDGQHIPEEIPALLEPLTRNAADIVFGVRPFHTSMPLVARIGNVFLTGFLNLLFHIRVSDTQSGFRAFRLRVYPKIEWQSPRYAVETEMIVNAGKHHIRFAERPIRTVYLDKYRGTTVFDGIRIFVNMILWKFL